MEDRLPLHGLLDTILGLSIRDLVFKTPEELQELKKMPDEKIKETGAGEESNKT